MNGFLSRAIESRREGPEFGTNTGRQGIFDPSNPREKSMAIERLRSLLDHYGERLTPNFSGETGLRSNDAQGWSRMLNAQTEAQNISRLLQDRDPLQVRFGGSLGSANSPYESTMFAPGQSSSVTGRSFGNEEDSLRGLRNFRGSR